MIVSRVESVFFHSIVVVVVDAHPLGTRPHRFADDDAAAGLERVSRAFRVKADDLTPAGGW